MIDRTQGNRIGRGRALAGMAAAALLLVVVPAASAAPRISIRAKRVINFGQTTKVTGRLAGVADPAGVRIDLQEKLYPYTGAFRTVATRRTDATGAYSFSPKTDRNARYRVMVRGGSPTSGQAPVYVNGIPLTFISVHGARVNARMTFTFSRNLATSMFSNLSLHWYYKAKSQKSFRRVRTTLTHRVRAGRIGGSMTYTIPKSTAKQKFTIAWCFRPHNHGDVGIGDPAKSFKACA
jgi:hypothetical protein